MKKSLLLSLCVASSLFAYDVDLNSGWNIVGIQQNAEAHVLLDAGCEFDAIYAYNANGWNYYRNENHHTFSQLEKGKGYFVYAQEACTLSISEAHTEEEVQALQDQINTLSAQNYDQQTQLNGYLDQINDLMNGCQGVSSSSSSSLGGSVSSSSSSSVSSTPYVTSNQTWPGPETFRIGNAVSPVNYWMTAWMFNDVFKQAGIYSDTDDLSDKRLGSAWVPDHNQDHIQYLQLDAQGWPTSMTMTNGQHANELIAYLIMTSQENIFPGGRYTVTYEGEGTLRFEGATIVSSEPGRMVIDYDGGNVLWAVITQTDPNNNGNYIRNVSVIRPDAMPGERFTRTYLDYLRPFSVIRPLHLIGETLTYGTTPLAWSDRKPENYANWGGNMGAPYEVVIDLANQSVSDLWLNLPIAATDDFLRNLANLMHERLDGNRKLYVELGNEIWNYEPPYGYGHNYALAQAEQTWPGIMGEVRPWSDEDPVNAHMMAFSWQGKRTIEACEIFRTQWANDSDRVICVASGQIGASGQFYHPNRYILETPVYVHEGNGRRAGDVIDAFAIAPYVGEPEVVAFDRTSPEAFFADATHYLNGTGIFVNHPEEESVRQMVRNDHSLAHEFNLPLVAYEGGHHFIGSTFTRDVISNHSLMYDLYRDYFTMWQEENGGLFVHYAGIIPKGENEPGTEPSYYESENFGIFEHQAQPDTPKLDAILDTMTAVNQR